MTRRLLAALVAATLAGLLIPLLASPASAHEAKTVGRYHFVVGFGDEPAYAGEKNSVQLILADAKDRPVTDPGSYSFHFTGTIKGQRIDQTFKSGPQSFSDIEDPAEVQYPVKQPTGAQLATRADRETARVNAALTAERDQAKDDAASARTLAIIGLLVGLLGLTAGAVALARGRRAPAQAAPAHESESAAARPR